jgi:hypothetical protein
MIKYLIASIAVLCCLSKNASAQVSSTATISRQKIHALTIPAMSTAADSLVITNAFNSYRHRMNLSITMASQGIQFTTDGNIDTKDLMEILQKAGYSSYYLLPQNKKAVMKNDGTFEIWDVK